MSVATIAEIRAGIATNLTAPFQAGWLVSGYLITNITLPTIDVLPGPIDYDEAMGGGAHGVELKIRARIPANDSDVMQVALDALVDPASATSLKKAVESDKTLGGKVAWTRVKAASDYRLYEDGALGVEFTVEVQT